GRVLDRHLALELDREQLDLVVRERLIRVLHLAEVHQELDQLRDGGAERLGEVADGDTRLHGDGAGGRRDLAGCLGLARLDAVARPLALTGAGAAAAALDDDTALPVSRAAASPWPDRSSSWHESLS